MNNPSSSSIKYSDAAFPQRLPRQRRTGLALLESHDQQRQQLHQDVHGWLQSGHRIQVLSDGICQGLSKYDPENLSLFGAMNEFDYG